MACQALGGRDVPFRPPLVHAAISHRPASSSCCPPFAIFPMAPAPSRADAAGTDRVETGRCHGRRPAAEPSAALWRACIASAASGSSNSAGLADRRRAEAIPSTAYGRRRRRRGRYFFCLPREPGSVRVSVAARAPTTLPASATSRSPCRVRRLGQPTASRTRFR